MPRWAQILILVGAMLAIVSLGFCAHEVVFEQILVK